MGQQHTKNIERIRLKAYQVKKTERAVIAATTEK